MTKELSGRSNPLQSMILAAFAALSLAAAIAPAANAASTLHNGPYDNTGRGPGSTGLEGGGG
jgi:hypothetical protein